ncbi:MAG: ribulose-phosphate 3-epimerase [Elusimicrobiota bacterium]
MSRHRARRPRPDGRVRIVPSLLAADFAAVGRDLAPLAAAGARWASVDVMDGHFVPNLSFGPDLVRALRRKAGVYLDAHLMVDAPGMFGPLFAGAGADWVTFHVEACRRPRPLLRRLRSLGVGVGLAVKPGTPADALIRYLEDVDLALVMTVEPGFGAQEFLVDMLEKIRAVRRAIDRRRLPVWLQVDGGVNAGTAPLVAAAGADSIVAGTAVFRAKDPVAAMRALQKSAQRAFDGGGGGSRKI